MRQFKIEFKWSVILAITLLVWMYGEKALGFHDERIDQHYYITLLFFIPSITIYVLTILDKRKNFYEGRMTYKQGFMAGLVMTGFSLLWTPVNQVIVSLIITPDYFKNVIEYTVAHNLMTLEEAQAQFNLTSYIIQGLISFPIVGAFTSAIIALFTRKK